MHRRDRLIDMCVYILLINFASIILISVIMTHVHTLSSVASYFAAWHMHTYMQSPTLHAPILAHVFQATCMSNDELLLSGAVI